MQEDGHYPYYKCTTNENATKAGYKRGDYYKCIGEQGTEITYTVVGKKVNGYP